MTVDVLEIRNATLDDLDALVSLGRQMQAESVEPFPVVEPERVAAQRFGRNIRRCRALPGFLTFNQPSGIRIGANHSCEAALHCTPSTTTEFSESSAKNICAGNIPGMSAYGYKETFGAPRREVCFPLESGRECPEIQKPRDLGSVTARKRTSGTSSPNVCK